MDPAERIGKQTTGSAIGFVNGFSVGVEEIGACLACRRQSPALPRFVSCSPTSMDRCILVNANSHMEMIAHQAIGKCAGDWLNVMRIQLKEVRVVSLFAEQIFPINATIEDVVVAAGLQR